MIGGNTKYGDGRIGGDEEEKLLFTLIEVTNHIQRVTHIIKRASIGILFINDSRKYYDSTKVG